MDSEVLIEGDAGIDCGSDEKKCPIDREDPDGPKECVGTTSPQYGCARTSCKACDLDGATVRCSPAGDCDISQCNEGRLDCDNEVTNGCEVDSKREVNNCGGCGNETTRAFICELANASNTCVGGKCGIGVCLPGFGNCDGSTSNGCEVDLKTSGEHCGDCDSPCAGSCVDGECM